MTQEALKMALEALEADPLEMVADVDGHMVFLKDKAITAIKEALAQPVFDCPRCGHVCSQRPWQELTPDEVKHLYPYGRSVWGKETFEAIEKALKDKNT